MNTDLKRNRMDFVILTCLLISQIKSNKQENELLDIIKKSNLAPDYEDFEKLYFSVFKKEHANTTFLKNVLELLFLYMYTPYKDNPDEIKDIHSMQSAFKSLLQIKSEKVLVQIVGTALILLISVNNKNDYCISTPNKHHTVSKSFNNIKNNMQSDSAMLFLCLLYSDLAFYGYFDFFSDKIKEHSAFSFAEFYSKDELLTHQKDTRCYAEEILHVLREDDDIKRQYILRKGIVEGTIDVEFTTISDDTIETKLKNAVYTVQKKYPDDDIEEIVMDLIEYYLKKGVSPKQINRVCWELQNEFLDKSDDISQNIADIFGSIYLDEEIE